MSALKTLADTCLQVIYAARAPQVPSHFRGWQRLPFFQRDIVSCTTPHRLDLLKNYAVGRCNIAWAFGLGKNATHYATPFVSLSIDAIQICRNSGKRQVI